MSLQVARLVWLFEFWPPFQGFVIVPSDKIITYEKQILICFVKITNFTRKS